MLITLFTVFAIYGVYPISSRLIERNTETTFDSIHVKSTVPSRIKREISEEESVPVFSKEDDHSSEPSVNSKEPKTISQRQAVKLPKISRELKENLKKSTTQAHLVNNAKVLLVKKPIPKFNEIDYEDDFQTKVIRSASKYAESGEHEDEDFNLDDYDFDVNHDEYAGRGKPLEPRQRLNKNLHFLEAEPDSTPKPKTAPPVVKIQSKVVIPSRPKVLSKREHSYGKITNKAADKMKEDYYDEIGAPSTKAPEVVSKSQDADEDSNEDSDDSCKDYDRKLGRAVRSPWMGQAAANNVTPDNKPKTWSNNMFRDKLREKSSGMILEMTGILPMFPALQRDTRSTLTDLIDAKKR